VRINRNTVAGLLIAASAVTAAVPGTTAVAAAPPAASQSSSASPRVSGTAAVVIGYARAQIGKPYLWGGTGPAAFDCSGLVYMAYAQAGIAIARTSQEQWATEAHIPAAQAAPGDLVFFAGGDGTPSAPGHVGLVLDPASHSMIEAYATGYAIHVSTYGLDSSLPGDGDPVGFTDPGAGR
jgi:cell wall-associated NlpC family hydrolase